ncbi:hypothetical protein [Rosenbergiella australiborealis]|uniref:hypothetical protein n=1 Tax=Rosenbergiella australiborealis TaxID=1544696 RepID=UPI001F4E9D32|nr:hypothetical protein [Rosenbergiella australiborealis]
MKKVKGITIPCVLLLSACASTQKTDEVSAQNGSSVPIFIGFIDEDLNNDRYADNVLREVTPTHTGVGLGINILASVLSKGLSVTTFTKENLRGNQISSLPEPTKFYLTPKAKPIISDWLEKNTQGYQYKNVLNIGAAKWLLVYQDLSSNNSNYELRYTVKFYKKPENSNIFSSYIISDCTPKPEVATLTDWRANNYMLVQETTRKYMDFCLLQLENQLPRLLKH